MAKPRMLVKVKLPPAARKEFTKIVTEAAIELEQWINNELLPHLPLTGEEGEFSISYTITHKPGNPLACACRRN